MPDFAFPPPPVASVAIAGRTARYPVARIFCVGRNYAEHVREMGNEPDPGPPFYFTKSPAHLVASGATIPYPPGTADFHHEVELVLALGAPAFGITPAEALATVHGYAVGIDLTRRDLQAAAKAKSRPWDIAKDFELSAGLAPLAPAQGFVAGQQAISLSVNGAQRQSARLSDMIHSVPAILAHLSTLYHLGPGDLVFTGTPAGVGPLLPGDHIAAAIDGLPPLELTIGT